MESRVGVGDKAQRFQGLQFHLIHKHNSVRESLEAFTPSEDKTGDLHATVATVWPVRHEKAQEAI
eukprot:1140355-Pelagomonas_calceolata.AAC.9